jgi:undecaprenyl-diphosphatase
LPIYQAIILGIVQGLTEFLPVSSSGHLIIIPWLLGWKDPGLTFDVALHAGTLIAVLGYFAPLWIRIFRAAFGGKVGVLMPVQKLPGETGVAAAQRTAAAVQPQLIEHARHERMLLWLLVGATIPGAIAGALLEKQADTIFRKPVLIGVMTVAVGLIMWLAEAVATFRKRITEVGWGEALAIGAAQACAIVPGVSRSGSTISAGLFCGMTREAAARFSFLLSTPIIAGAALLKAHHMIKHPLPHAMYAPFAAGFLASALVGYAAIAALMRYLRSHSLKVFVVYRLVFGIIVLALAYRGFFH